MPLQYVEMGADGMIARANRASKAVAIRTSPVIDKETRSTAGAVLVLREIDTAA